jgi:HlyD family secretion protein
MQGQPSLFRQSAVDRLATPEDLDELMHVAPPRYWLVLVALGGLLITAIIWSIVTTIPTTVAAAGALGTTPGGLQAVVFVPADKAVQVRPGMDVKLTIPATAALQPMALAGTVASVAAAPADQQTLLRTLGNAAYIQALTSGGEFVPVHVALPRRLGMAAGAPQRGMPLHAVITVARQRVIQLVVP